MPDHVFVFFVAKDEKHYGGFKIIFHKNRKIELVSPKHLHIAKKRISNPSFFELILFIHISNPYPQKNLKKKKTPDKII